MVLKQVTDHQDEAAALGLGDETCAIGVAHRQRLLDEDVLSRRERLLDEAGMLLGGRGDGHRVDLAVGQYFSPGAGSDGIFGGEGRGDLGTGIDDRRERAETGEVSHQIGTPVAAPGDRHTSRLRHWLRQNCTALPVR